MTEYTNGRLTTERQTALSTLPGWTWDETNDLLKTVRKWSAWVRTNEGTYPHPDATTNQVERKLGIWAYNMRTAILTGQVTEVIQAQLSSASSYWRSFIEAAQSPPSRFHDAIDYHHSNDL